MSDGIASESLKEAVLKYLRNKSDVDEECFKNYRPMSNLSFVSELIKKKLLLQDWITQDVHETLQPAYVMFHLTEAAILRVQSDQLRAIDKIDDDDWCFTATFVHKVG